MINLSIKLAYIPNEERLKTENGTMLVEKKAIKERWVEYFELMLNVEEDKEAKIVAVGRENGVKVFGRLNNAQIKEEAKDKAAQLDGCAAEYLKSGSTNVIEWLVKLLNVFCDFFV